MERSPDEETVWPTTLWVGVALSIIWFAVLLVYAFWPNAATGGNGIEPISRWRTFWNSPPHEFGDALAGIFAPPAFLWLVVATFLQKEELRAQRLEHKRSVEQLAISASAQKQAQVDHAAEKAERDLQQRLGSLSDLITQACHTSSIRVAAPSATPHYVFGGEKYLKDYKNSSQGDFYRYVGQRRVQLQKLLKENDEVYCCDEARKELQKVCSFLQRIIEDHGETKNSTIKDMLDSLGIRLLEKDLKLLIATAKPLRGA